MPMISGLTMKFLVLNLNPTIKRLRMVNNGAMMAATGVTSFTLNGLWALVSNDVVDK